MGLNCANCGNAVGPGVRDCPFCGNAIYNNNYVYASMTLSWEDARRGGLHELTMPNLLHPLRVRVKPRTRSGDKIRVAGAMFSMADESVMLAPVEVVVHVERRPLWQPLLAILVCVLMTAAAGVGIWTARRSGGRTTQQSMSTTISTTAPNPTSPTDLTTAPTQPVQQTTAPTQPDVTETTTPTQPDVTETTAPTQPDTTETTAPTQPEEESIIMNYELRPLLHMLTEEHLEIFEAMYQSVLDFEESFVFEEPLTEDEAYDLVLLLNAECPELMHLDVYGDWYYYTDTTTGLVTSVVYDYCMTEAEYREKYEACEDVIESLVAQSRGMTDWEKEQLVFDYITENCRYDKYVNYCGTAYGTLVQELAKCDGISLGTKWVLEEMGITCIMVVGDPKDGDEGHAWNYVLLDGEYYGLDVTADVSKPGEESPVMHHAYNVTSALLEKAFILRPIYVDYLYSPQVTTMEKSYHALNGSYFTAGQDWRPYAQAAFLAACADGSGFGLQFETEADFQAFRQEVDSVLISCWRTGGMSGNVSWITWSSDGFLSIYVDITIT